MLNIAHYERNANQNDNDISTKQTAQSHRTTTLSFEKSLLKPVAWGICYFDLGLFKKNIRRREPRGGYIFK